MLSGFQSGVTRGRGEDSEASGPPSAQDRVPVPAGTPGVTPAPRTAVSPARTGPAAPGITTSPSTDDTSTTD